MERPRNSVIWNCVTAVFVLMSVSVSTRAEIAPIVGPWEHSAGACTNFSNAVTWGADCVHLDGGTWVGANAPVACVNPSHPRPWPSDENMESYVSARNGGAATAFNGWLAPGGSSYCLGYFDTGSYGETLGVESKNFGLFTINGAVGSYGARRDRDVSCPSGSSIASGRCVRHNAADPYKGFDQCPTNGTNPVNTFNGEKIHIETDYQGHDADPLLFKRYYASNSSLRWGPWEQSGFGGYWRHNYSKSIKLFDDATQRLATVYLENGDRHYFQEVAVGSGTQWQALDPDVVEQLSLASVGGSPTWILITDGGREEHYDVDTGRLRSIWSRQDHETTLSYDSSGRLEKVTNAFGRGLKFSYYAEGIGAGLIESVIVTVDDVPMADGKFRYTYESTYFSGDTITLIDRVYFPDKSPNNDDDNPNKDYLYDESDYIYYDIYADVEAGPSTSSFSIPWALTGIIDENGDRFATYKYKRFLFNGGYKYGLAAGGGHGTPDANGRYADQYTILAYHADAHRGNSRSHSGRTIIRDANGVQREHHFAFSHGVLRPTSITGGACESCGSDIQNTSYDPATGFVTSQTDYEGNVTVLNHNEFGLEVCRLEGVSSTDPGSKNAPRRIVTEWDPTIRVKTLEKIYAPNGVPDLAVCDNTNDTGWAKVKETESTYLPGSARVSSRTERHFPRDPAHPDRTTTFSYYGAGESDGMEYQLKAIDGPRTDVADVTTYKYAVTSSASHQVGDLIAITDAEGLETKISKHDPHGRAIDVQNNNRQRHKFTYDPRGRLTESRIINFDTDYTYDDVGNLTKVTLPDGSYTRFTYDTAHRLTGVEDNLGNKIVYTLDAMGNRTKEDVEDPSQKLRRTVSRVYDNLNRLEKIIDGVGNETVFTYDGNNKLDTTTDPKLNVTDNNYDALGRVRAVIDALSVQTTFEYDVLDNIVSVTDPRSNATTYKFNAFGDLLTLDSPDAGEWTYTYDEAGNRISSTDARGVSINYEYDALNRLTKIDYPTETDVRFIYDTGGHWTHGRKGRIAKMIDESGTTEYRYDARGKLKEATSTIAGVEYSIWYDYDLAGRIKTMSYPSGRRIDYERDAIGNVIRLSETVAGTTTVLVSNVTYDAYGPANIVDYAQFADPTSFEDTATTRQIGRDLAGRFRWIIERRDFTNAGGQSDDHEYLDWSLFYYDENSNVRVADRYFPASQWHSWTLSYDEQNRLLSRDSRVSFPRYFYSYDANGNRTQEIIETRSSSTTIGSIYESDSNRLASINYDAAGNELGFGEKEYSEGGRLRRVFDSQGAELMTYSYNGLGYRVKKTDGAISKIFHYDQEGRLIAETNELGDPIAEYVYLNGEPFAIAVNGDSVNAATPAFVSDPGNGLVWRRRSNPEASNNQVLLSPPQNSANSSTGSTATYPVTVSKSGNYTLYIRGRGSDWAGQGVHFSDSIRGRTTHKNFGNAQWAFEWNRYRHLLPISTARVGTPFEIYMNRRQRDVEIDVFVLSLDSGLTSNELDGLVGLNGAPTTLPDTYVWEAEGAQTWTADGGDIYFYHNDHLGTPQFITDGWGNHVWEANYDPYGKATITTEMITNNLRFPGQYFDAETGLHYNMFRDYNPVGGRYVQSDPIGLDGGLNTYSYVGGNPLRFIDRYGLSKMCHRSIEGGIPGRHCFIEFEDGSTSSFAPDGVGPDRNPNSDDRICTEPKEPEKDDCVRKAMKKCEGSYNFLKFNCCHCAEQAMKECGVSPLSPDTWPNWPINPGPQSGEPGYSPLPIYGNGNESAP